MTYHLSYDVIPTKLYEGFDTFYEAEESVLENEMLQLNGDEANIYIFSSSAPNINKLVANIYKLETICVDDIEAEIKEYRIPNGDRTIIVNIDYRNDTIAAWEE